MGSIWNRALNGLTRGAGMRDVVIRSFGLALCGTLAAIPYFHRLGTAALEKGRFPRGLEYGEFLCAQLLLLFILCLLSSVVGFSFSKRYELPGFGSGKKLVQHLPALLGLGAAIIGLSYVLFDRIFIFLSPMSYPSDPISLLFFPFKGALTEETILRLCLVTLCVGFFRGKLRGVVAASAVASLFTWKYFQFVGAEVGFNYLFTVQMGLAFVVNAALGYLFVTEGLIYAMTLKFILSLKYVLLWWLHG